MTLTVGSLFTGIGGLDLGLERAGMRVIWQAEIEPYCCRVLAKHWPAVPNLGDITTIEWGTVEPPDVICGGYPCQPFSLAGVRAGADDPRHLWPAMLVAIRELRPRFAIMENVAGHLSMGFGRVLGDLAASGYDTQWDCIPAAAVGAPHRRDRVFVVAYPQREQLRHESKPIARRHGATVARDDGPTRALADTSGVDGQRPEPSGDSRWRPETSTGNSGTCLADADGTARNGPRPAGKTLLRPRTVERLGRRGCSDGGQWAVEPDVGRMAHGVPARVDRLRALGNAVVPQVAEHVGRRLLDAYEVGTVERFGVGVADVSARDVDDEIVQRGDELGARAVGFDGDGDRVGGHGEQCDARATEVKGP